MTPSALRPATLPRPASDAAQPAALRERLASHLPRRGAPAVLVLMAALASATSSTFPTWSNISSILGNNAFVWLLALGMTFVILTGGIDLSVGSVYALGGVLGAYGAHTGGTWLAVVLPLTVGALWGAAQGLLVARARMAPFIVTLAGLRGARGLLPALTNEGATTYLVPADSAFRRLGDGTWAPVLLVAALFGSGALLLTRTRFGATVTALGGNANAATLMGLPVARTKILVYVLPATRAATAGALGSARLGSGVTTIGVGYELTAIASVVIGGTLLTGGSGSIGGTASGVLVLAVIHNLIDHSFSQYGSAFTDTVNGAFLAVVVLVQTLLGRTRQTD